ncbi:MAG: carboxy terminal-processing peptidase [Planctomycetales bacterium]|nr:carboxy terminal-processing peptidase [Planctomycetales bacterium]
MSACLWTLCARELDGQRDQDRRVTKVVTTLMSREHLSQKEIDDEVSRRGLKTFLKTLDPMKLYFYQADIDQAMAKQTDLDDEIDNGNIQFAYDLFDTFLKRVDERVAQVNTLLGQKHDFTVDEEMITDADVLSYPKDSTEAAERWRKRIKYDLLVLKADKTEGQEAIDKLRRRYENFAKRMKQTKSDDLLEMYLTAMTSSFDPHTTYMSPSTLENFRIQMRLNLEGIGAALSNIDGYTTISKVIPGGAADKHGKLKPEDRVVSVGQGEEGEMVDVVDMSLNDVVGMIRGKAGTVVRLGVIPDGSTETKIYAITRERIELEDSAARADIIEEKDSDNASYKIGVIDLPSFYMDMEAARDNKSDYRSTTRDVRAILDDFTEKGVDAVVLDLRRNGGGSLTEAINLTGLFIDQGPVVQVKDSDNNVQHYDDLEEGMAWKGPLVVLTSKFSASASEILAGAIQDYGRGIVVGDESTHGKGTVQSLLDLGSQVFGLRSAPNLGALKITMQQFYRPNGDSTQKRGVLADVVLPSLTNEMPVSEGDLDYAMEFDKVPSARFSKYGMVSAEALAQMRAKSAERRAKSEEFDKLLKRIESYVRQKQRKRVPLNEEKFFAQRAELDADKVEEQEFENQQNSDEEVIKRDYYFNEVLHVTVDYLNALGDHKVARVN